MRAVSDSQPPIASVRILGGVHAVASDGSLIDLPSASQRRLLAILAVHSPRRLRSEWLADVLEISPGALRTSVSRVRASVGSAMLETGSTGIRTRRRGRRARDSAERSPTRPTPTIGCAPCSLRSISGTGPRSKSSPGRNGPTVRSRDSRRSTREPSTTSPTRSSRHDGPRTRWRCSRRRSPRNPYRDRPRGLLIRALASAGRQADALRAFQQYRSLLIEEFGTDPSPDVIRIERRVATGWDGMESAPIDERRAAKSVTRWRRRIPLPSALAHAGRVRRAPRELDDACERARARLPRRVCVAS